jgi:transposase
MARYKHTDTENGQGLFLSVNLKEQLLPGTFEHMLDELIGKRIDTSVFDKNYKNDETGAKAIPPEALMKLIIYGYTKGVKSSRGIGELSRNNIIAKALAEDMEPHWTTIAGNGGEFKELFVRVLAYCAELGLIGGETLAIDGCRLPSNASLGLTGTEEGLKKRLAIYRRMAEKHIAKHRRRDASGEADGETERHYRERQHKLNRQIEKISGFLENMEKKEGRRIKEMRSNVTDNESAMIKSPSGYIQGYIGLAVSDKKEQIIISAEAAGTANEGEHLPRMLDETLVNIREAMGKPTGRKKPVILADKNYFSEENLKACRENGVEAVIADRQYKKRLGKNAAKRYEADDFRYHKRGDYYTCPHGKRLEYKETSVLEGQEGRTYRASVTDCRVCPLHAGCLKSKKDISKIDKGRSLRITESNEV